MLKGKSHSFSVNSISEKPLSVICLFINKSKPATFEKELLQKKWTLIDFLLSTQSWSKLFLAFSPTINNSLKGKHLVSCSGKLKHLLQIVQSDKFAFNFLKIQSQSRIN